MNNTKHTSGPWHVDPVAALVNESATGLPLCAMQWPSDERSEAVTKANARLIAAAPDLLEALQQICNNGGVATNAILIAARALITKATGEKP